MSTQNDDLFQRLTELVDEYARLHGGLFEGMAALGEDLLLQADTRRDGTVSWLGLLRELQRRSG